MLNLFIKLLIVPWVLSIEVAYGDIESCLKSQNCKITEEMLLNKTPVEVVGLWDVYLHQLISPETNLSSLPSPILTSVAKPWPSDEKIHIASYQKKIAFDKEEILAFQFPTTASARKFWFNDNLIFEQGRVADTKDLERIGAGNIVVFVPVKKGINTMTIQISNFHHYYGGHNRNILIARPTAMSSYNHTINIRDAIILGAILIMSFYHLFLWGIRPSSRAALFFSFFCLSIGLRSSFTAPSQVLFLFIDPDKLFLWGPFFEYVGLTLLGPSFLLFLREQFKEDFPLILIRTMYLPYLCYLPLVFLTPATFYPKFLPILQVMTGVFGVVLILLLVRSVLRQREGAILSFLGTVTLVGTGIHDILRAQAFFDGDELTHIGTFSILFFQATSLAYRFTKSFFKLDQAEKNIRSLNDDLERKVLLRTEDLDAKILDLNKTKKALDEANDAKLRFLGKMSHETQTPLHAITGFTELIEEELQQSKISNDKVDSYLRSINESTDRLEKLFKNILFYSRFNSGSIILRNESISLHQLIQNVYDEMVSHAREKNINLVLINNLDMNLHVLSDKDKLSQIALNLIDNAIKFTHPGKTVTIKAQYSELSFEFSVEDEGIGIKQENQKDVFADFHQIHDGGKTLRQGAGLGLSIVKGLVDLMKGKITLKSYQGRGSIFSVSLPLVEISAPSKAQSGYQVEGQKEYLIYAADDNDLNLMLIERKLSKFKVELELFSNGKDLYQRSLEKSPDLVLLDLQMPVMDGIETAKALRQHDFFTAMPIVCLTADILPETKDKVKQAGMNELLTKPFKITELLTTLANLCIYLEKNEDKKSA